MVALLASQFTEASAPTQASGLLFGAGLLVVIVSLVRNRGMRHHGDRTRMGWLAVIGSSFLFFLVRLVDVGVVDAALLVGQAALLVYCVLVVTGRVGTP